MAETRSPLDDFEALQKQMDEFSVRFDNTVTSKRAQILDDKQQHQVRIHELESQEKQLQAQIGALKTKGLRTKDVVRRTLEELQTQQLKVDELLAKHRALNERKDALQREVDTLNADIASINRDISESNTRLDEQIKRDHPELLLYETYLGLRISAVQANLLRFSFTNVDPVKTEKAVWCNLDVGSDAYKVGEMYPQLGEAVVAGLEADFNKNGDFTVFLKTIRQLLKDA